MASEIEICNLALSHLGDTATVASINPSEGSAQAEHCARFYPIARNSLLEMHAWGFATRRIQLSLMSETVQQWDYIYQVPQDMIKALAVIDYSASDDYSVNYRQSYETETLPNIGAYSPQQYVIETLSTGQRVIMTNQQYAMLRYVARVTDPTVFSPLFTMTLSHMLASMLAGPVIKGDAGKAESKAQLAMAKMFLAEAAVSDSEQRDISITHVVPWLAGR